MKLNIAVLAGDGIGPEISAQGVAVLTAVCQKFGHELSLTPALVGAAAIDAVGNPFPPETLNVCKAADAVLFSAVGDPKYDNNPNAKVRPEQGLLAMRQQLGLFANIRPVQTFKCLLHKSPLRAELVQGADFVCIRELTGGMYFGKKQEGDDYAYDTNAYSREEVERILKVAYQYAARRRGHLTVVDKANVLASSRLWRKVAQEMAAQYPEVQTDFMYVDNAAMRMIQEPTHGSWPQAAGQNIANPLAQILSVAMLFEHFGLTSEGKLVRQAVDASLDANVRTPEIQVPDAPHYGTKEVGEWIVQFIKTAGNE